MGQTLRNRYRLEERIGRGGMGVVFRATDLEAVRLGQDAADVAIKVLTAPLGDEEAVLFEEVQKTRQLQQENIVDVYGFEPDESGSFMVMELLAGRPLDRHIRDFWPQGMPLGMALPLIKSMADALGYAHRQGVIHSDFKPSNVFVGADTVKVLDFGIARAARSPVHTGVGERPTGITPAYASCEMLEEQPADRRDDVFCFGLVVYFMLSGGHPFNGLPATEARDLGLTVPPLPRLTSRQNAALADALRFARDGRSASVAELLESLAPPATGRHLRWGAPGALGLLAVLGTLVYLAEGARQDSPDELARSLCSRMGGPPHAPAPGDAQLVPTLLVQGEHYLEQGLHPFDPGLLSENVSSSLGAFQSALALDPQQCDAAAQGIVKVAMAYRDEARRLYSAGDYRKAAATARIGLRIWTGSRELRTLLMQISRHVPAEPDPVPGKVAAPPG